jgi:hypothetical protein
MASEVFVSCAHSKQVLCTSWFPRALQKLNGDMCVVLEPPILKCCVVIDSSLHTPQSKQRLITIKPKVLQIPILHLPNAVKTVVPNIERIRRPHRPEKACVCTISVPAAQTRPPLCRWPRSRDAYLSSFVWRGRCLRPRSHSCICQTR